MSFSYLVAESQLQYLYIKDIAKIVGVDISIIGDININCSNSLFYWECVVYKSLADTLITNNLQFPTDKRDIKSLFSFRSECIRKIGHCFGIDRGSVLSEDWQEYYIYYDVQVLRDIAKLIGVRGYEVTNESYGFTYNYTYDAYGEHRFTFFKDFNSRSFLLKEIAKIIGVRYD